MTRRSQISARSNGFQWITRQWRTKTTGCYTPTAPLDVSFNAFTANPNVSKGYTYFTIFNPITIAAVFSSGDLPASTTSLVIPANTLQPNTSYGLEFDFSDRLSGTDSVNDVPTLQGFDVRTDIDFTTAVPEPLSAAALGAVTCICLLRRQTSRETLKI